MENKEERIVIRVSAEEKEKIGKKAEEKGLKISTYLRCLGLNKKI